MKKCFLFGPMAIALLLASCSQEDVVSPDEGGGVATVDQTLYVKFAIHGGNSTSTRAAGNDGAPVEGTDFADGTGESDVENAYFVFYNADGNVVGEAVPVSLTTETDANGSGTVDKYYQSTVAVNVQKNEALPTQVVCYINVATPSDLNKPLYEIQTVTREEVKRTNGTKNYFPMSNSVYYPNTGASVSSTQLPVIAVDVSGKLKDSAAAAAAEPAIDIYVERYAAKLKFSATGVEPYVTSTVTYTGNTATESEVKLTFVPERWALNGETKNTYVIKSFRTETGTGLVGTDNYTFGAANTAINNGLSGDNAWTWNNAGYKRSYWACSPAYFVSSYPEVADDVTNADSYPQKYYKYVDLTGTNAAGFPTTQTDWQYFRETTVGSNALSSANPAAATPSVLLVGHYTMTVGTSTDVVKSAFYTYTRSLSGTAAYAGKPQVFFPNTPGAVTSAVSGGASMLQRFFMELTCLYENTADAGETPKYVRLDPTDASDLAKLIAALEVADPKAEVTGNMKVPARYRTLQFKDGAATTGIYVATGKGYQPIGTEAAGSNNISLVNANKILMQQVGFCNYYSSTENITDANAGGKAYFSIPVLHLGWYRKGNTQKDSGKIDWEKVKVGDMGLVRNHAYQVNVTKISGLATGIGGYYDPLIPPADTKDQYISYKVNILQWAMVPTQNVTLE